MRFSRKTWPAVVVAVVVAMVEGPVEAQIAAASAERLTVGEAMRLALARNPSVEVADAEVDRAQGVVEQARSAAIPTLFANASYTRLDGNRQVGAPPNVKLLAGENEFFANLAATVPLVVPRSWSLWSHAIDGRNVARSEALNVRRELAAATARTFLAVVLQKRILGTAEHAHAISQDTYEFARGRRAGRLGNRLDEVRAANRLAGDDVRVSRARVELTRVREALGVLVGSANEVDAADEAVTLPDLPPSDEALKEATSRRADVALDRTLVQSSARFVRDEWTDYAPYITMTGQVFYQNPATVPFPLTGYQAQIVLTLPLYDGGNRTGEKRQREVAERKASADLDGAIRQARSDVRVALDEVRRAEEALSSAREAARAAQETLDLANEAYKEGTATSLDVLDAERGLTEADLELAFVEDQERQSRVDVLFASGRLP